MERSKRRCKSGPSIKLRLYFVMTLPRYWALARSTVTTICCSQCAPACLPTYPSVSSLSYQNESPHLGRFLPTLAAEWRGVWSNLIELASWIVARIGYRGIAIVDGYFAMVFPMCLHFPPWRDYSKSWRRRRTYWHEQIVIYWISANCFVSQCRFKEPGKRQRAAVSHRIKLITYCLHPSSTWANMGECVCACV